MVRRSGAITGLGNPDPELMNGQSTGDKSFDASINTCSKECYETFFKGTSLDFGGVDAGVDGSDIHIGIEPAYFGDNLRMITFAPNKNRCSYTTGHAFGYYGSGIRSKTKHYSEYIYDAKFKRFIDKWHPLLFSKERTISK